MAWVRAGETGSLDFTQQGTGNEFDAYTAGYGASAVGRSIGNYNRVEITQWYHDVSLDIEQVGSGNFISARQGFQGHTSTISQIGKLNQATLLQDSTTYADQGSIATIMQNGLGNVATTVQQ